MEEYFFVGVGCVNSFGGRDSRPLPPPRMRREYRRRGGRGARVSADATLFLLFFSLGLLVRRSGLLPQPVAQALADAAGQGGAKLGGVHQDLIKDQRHLIAR